jgi:hypothetical protein
VKYLETLTLRLAQGMARLPDEFRSRQASWLVGKQNADGGFSGREGDSDLYYEQAREPGANHRFPLAVVWSDAAGNFGGH